MLVYYRNLFPVIKNNCYQHLHWFFFYSIAMLTVSDDEFWEDVTPVEFGSLPALQDAVTVVGYPIGGDTISVTSGVVSRIEILSYVHGSTELLGLQVFNFNSLHGFVSLFLNFVNGPWFIQFSPNVVLKKKKNMHEQYESSQ